MQTRIIALALIVLAGGVHAETKDPTLTVTGQGSAVAAPDQATVVVAAMQQTKTAADAQAQVNRSMKKAIAAITALGVPQKSLSTREIAIFPVFDQVSLPNGESRSRLLGFRARNTLEVRLDNPEQVGPVIDAAVAAGVNEIESVGFGVKDERPLRRAALAEAVRDARLRADAIASAMGVRLLAVEEMSEQGVGVYLPMQSRLMKAEAFDAGTPVQPGEARVEASVAVRFRISPEIAPAD